MSLGMCVHPKRMPSRADLDELRPGFLRALLYDPADLDTLLATELPLFVTINNEFQGGWSAFDDACRLVTSKARGRVLGVGCGNELSGYWSVNPHDVPPSFGVDLIQRAAAILQPAGIRVFTDAVAGAKWVEYLRHLISAAGDDLGGVACQAAYGRAPEGWRPPGWSGGRWGFGDLGEVVTVIRAMTDLPIIFTEAGVKIGEAGGEDGQATYITALDAACQRYGVKAAFFCYEDSQGKPGERGASAFGLVNSDGDRRPAFDAFAALSAPQEAPPMPDYRAYARDAAARAKIPPDLFERQIQQESGFDPNAVSPAGAIGLAQIIPRFHPNVDPRDPIASLDYAAAWMGTLWRQYGSYKKALAAYNWGPGNVAGWDGSRAGLPAETRHYLDVILGAGWPEPEASTTPTPGDVSLILARVIELGKAEIGKPYSGPIVGQPDSYRRGDPGWDCSSFVEGMYERAAGQEVFSWAYTDTEMNESEWLKTPIPGCVVGYHYPDSSQPNTYWPHIGLWISPTEVLDCRFPEGVGIHPHVTPVSSGNRFRRTVLPLKIKGLVLPEPEQPPAQVDPVQQLRDQIAGLEIAVAQLADIEAGDKLVAIAAKAQEIRTQFIGRRP